MKKIIIFLTLIVFLAVFFLSKSNKTQKDSSDLLTQKTVAAKNDTTSNVTNENRNIASAPKADESGKKEEDLIDHLRSIGAGEWKFIRSPNGRIMSVSGGKVSGVGHNKESALNFAKTIAPYFQVAPSQIAARNDGKDFSQTAYTKIYRFEQKINDYKIHGSGITLMTKTQDSTAFMITTDLKEVKGLSFQAATATKAEDFKSVILNEFSQYKTIIKLTEPKPVIWADSDPAELAWVFVVETWNPKFNMTRVLVGADSGKILIKEKMSFN
ncbi:MAG: hypothetical protein WCK43_05170 [bacterium]